MTYAERLVGHLTANGPSRHRDLIAAGIPSVVIQRHLKRGLIEAVVDDRLDLPVAYAMPGAVWIPG